MKKKKIILIIAVISLFHMACSKKDTQVDATTFSIATSFYPIYIIAKNVTDNISNVEIKNMTPVTTGCLHDYSINADDMKRIERADVFLINGLGMESFTDKIAKKYPKLKIKELSKDLDIIKEGADINSHVWVSVANMIIMVKNCSTILEEEDPVNAEKYKNNSEKYIAKLKLLRDKMNVELKKIRGRKMVTFHEAFPYFARDYGLQIAAVVEREPGSTPSARELADTIKIIKDSGIQIIFSESQYPTSAAELIANETGALIYNLDPAVTGPDNLDAYLNIMNTNIDVIKKAYSRKI